MNEMHNQTFHRYAKEVSEYDTLTEHEEIELARIIKDGREAEQQLKNGNLTERQVRSNRNLVLAGLQAQEQLVNGNLRFGIYIAKRYIGRGLGLMDLIQEANRGIIRAAELYEADRGTRFATYAAIWIRQSIMRALATQARTIRVPTHMFDTINRVNRVTRQLTHQEGREPNFDDIMSKMSDKAPHHIELALANAPRSILSLDESMTEDGSLFEDITADTEAPEAHEAPEARALNVLLHEVLATLTERESQIIKLRFGFVDGYEHTLEEIGKMLGVSRQRIQQIESAALKKLRNHQSTLSAFND
jgi:RNA polymerase primary sigma factor